VILCDVNVLVYAFDETSPHHDRYASWLGDVVSGEQTYGASDVVLSAFLRIVTNPRIFNQPASMDNALAFTERIRDDPACHQVQPGPRHWGIFTRLCRKNGVRGNRVPDAYLVALAIESGAELASADRGFARFPGLRWRHPLDD
jgi:toxin-antitoxin system PIN domain toxin